MTKKRTTTKRTTRVSIRKTDGGYRITGDTRTFRSHSTAFNAAWRAAARAGASLYAITPDGRAIPLLTGRVIREIESTPRPAADSAEKSQNSGPASGFVGKSSELM